MSKAFRIVFLVFLVDVINVQTWEAIGDNDVVEVMTKPQVVKHEVSNESDVIKLKCNLLKNSLQKNRITGINELRWEHKKCGYGLNLTNCGNFPTIPWTPVVCKNGSKFCDGYTLKLENPKMTDSGYYRCLYKNYMSKQFKLYKIFHVDIYDPEASFEILDEPVQHDNHVIHANETVTFRCRARSLFPLHMFWAKLIIHERKLNRSIRYGMDTYEVLQNDGSYYVGSDLYISKLTLRNCQVQDTGKYYCIVVNVNNAAMMKNKTATLSVIPRIQNSGKFGILAVLHILSVFA